MANATSFEGAKALLPCPFVRPDDPIQTMGRMSLEPPFLSAIVSEYTSCMRRAGHTALIGFSDPTFMQCSSDAYTRYVAYRHWGEGGGSSPPAGKSEGVELPPSAAASSSAPAKPQRASTNTFKNDFSKNDGPFDKEMRFVLWERRNTVDVAKLPWEPKPAYLQVLRAQGRLPEQAEAALSAIKAGAWKTTSQ